MLWKWCSRGRAAVGTLIALLAVPGAAMAQQNSTVFPWQAGYSGGTSSGYYSGAPAGGFGNFGQFAPASGYVTPFAPATGYFVPAAPAGSSAQPDLGYVSMAPGAASTRATLVGHVPENARVWIEGEPTNARGALRRYLSPPLTAGENYRYTVRVEWNEAGKTVTRTETIPVRAGGTADFFIGVSR